MTAVAGKQGTQRGQVGLLVTCLIDTLRPQAAFAAAHLLEQAGYTVVVPEQGCCGQPNFNGGDAAGACAMALRVIDAFADCKYVVVPSGSCAAMLRVHYPTLFEVASADHARATDLARRTFELTEFLHDIAGFAGSNVSFDGTVVMHDSCSALRELGVRRQPRALLAQIQGCVERPLSNPEACCGFGGLFCVKYPDIAAHMAQKKIADIYSAGDSISALVSTDLGCLLHLAGKLQHDGKALPVFHIAELLDGSAVPDNRAGDGDAAGSRIR